MMVDKNKINVMNKEISFYNKDKNDYISLTDIAKYKDNRTDYILSNWFRNRFTIEFLGIWEKINNLSFNPIEFDGIRNKSGLNSFILTAKEWIRRTNAIGIISTPGRYGGTFAHKDIAFEFASWISVEFKLYLIKEFQRLKEKESKLSDIEWNVKRQLVKINYRIHTDAIKKNLIPDKLSKIQIEQIYANEADVLNISLYGRTAKDWKLKNKDKEGNIRDYSNVSQLVCLSNLESINALLIKEDLSQSKRLIKLNEIAIYQMKLLIKDDNVKKLYK